MTQKQGHFTPQASEVLDQELKDFGDLLRERATREAFSARGEPIEVTASDVKKARDALVKEKKYADVQLDRFRALSSAMGTGLVAVGAVWYFTGFQGSWPPEDLGQVILMAYGLMFLLMAASPTLFRLVFRRFLPRLGRETRED